MERRARERKAKLAAMAARVAALMSGLEKPSENLRPMAQPISRMPAMMR
jgi:hypothetical protein